MAKTEQWKPDNQRRKEIENNNIPDGDKTVPPRALSTLDILRRAGVSRRGEGVSRGTRFGESGRGKEAVLGRNGAQ